MSFPRSVPGGQVAAGTGARSSSVCSGDRRARGCVQGAIGRVSGRFRGVAAEGGGRGLHPLLRMQRLRRKD